MIAVVLFIGSVHWPNAFSSPGVLIVAIGNKKIKRISIVPADVGIRPITAAISFINPAIINNVKFLPNENKI